jgi:hypothetical protein
MPEWHIYEFIKRVFWKSGKILTEAEVRAEFPKESDEDIEKGIGHFQGAFEDFIANQDEDPERHYLPEGYTMQI